MKPCRSLVGIALWAVFGSVVVSIISQILAFLSLRHPARALLSLVTEDILADKDVIKQLSVFDRQHLDNFKDFLEMEVNHLRSRIGVMVGALETVGVIPAALALFGAFYTYQDVYKKNPSLFDWAAAIAAGVYIISVIFLSSARKLERYVRLLRVAAQSKQEKVVADPAAPRPS